ncbi:hypothetical protein [Arthrobacter pigmenti]
MGKKSREGLSYWKRIRRDEYGQPLPGALPDARNVSARHIAPQHVMYIK